MDTRRLILWVVFVFSVVMLWDAWLKQSHPVQPAVQSPGPAPSSGAAPAAAIPVPALAAAAAGASAVPASSAAPAPAAAEKVIVKTDLYTAEISTQGGDLIRLSLDRYGASDEEDKRFVLFDDGEHHVYEAQSGLIGAGLPNHKTLYQLVPGPRELKEGQDSLELRLEAAGADGVRTAKVFKFTRGSYLIDVSHEVANGSGAPITPSAYFQLARDGKPAEATSRMGASTFTGPAVYTEQSKYQKVSFEDIAKGKAKFADKSDNGWVAMVQHYFVAALLPQGSVQREYFMRKTGDDMYAAGVILPMASIAPGATGNVSVPLYAGPQEQDKLAKVAPGLNLVVDYGWLTVIAAPIFWVLEMIHRYVGNWGWSIILLTVLIKLVFFPLSAASYKSMAKMRLMSPKLTKLKETYGDDKQRLNQEMMELYKREKINPARRLPAYPGADSGIHFALLGVAGYGRNARRAVAGVDQRSVGEGSLLRPAADHGRDHAVPDQAESDAT